MKQKKLIVPSMQQRLDRINESNERRHEFMKTCISPASIREFDMKELEFRHRFESSAPSWLWTE